MERNKTNYLPIHQQSWLEKNVPLNALLKVHLEMYSKCSLIPKRLYTAVQLKIA